MSFSLFYLTPILLVTWFSGRKVGLAICVIGATSWFIADALAQRSDLPAIIRLWNAFVRLGFFVVVTLLLPALKALEHERAVARVDTLTGASNRHRFFEVLETELDRSQRYKRPFTIVYGDLDNFKIVNDHSGHETGDKLLKAVVNRSKRHLRRTDLIARIGGDEFALLLE